MANRNENDAPKRDRYRDNDDARHPLEGDDRSGVTPDTKSEARGDARDNVGNTARGTDAAVDSAGRSDSGEAHPRPDDYDQDLANSNRR